MCYFDSFGEHVCGVDGGLKLRSVLIAHFRVLVCLCQNESKGETILMKFFLIYKFIFMQIKLVFVLKVLHEDLF